MYEDRAALLLGISWIWSSLSLLCVVGRFIARYKYIGKIWWDDWCMLLSFLFALAITIIWTIYVSVHGLYHAYELTPEQLSQALLLDFIGQTFCVLAAAFTKTAIALLIARIQSKNFWRTVALYVISISSIVAGVIVLFVLWFECTPLQGLWRLELRATCWPSSVLIDNTIWVSSVWAVADLALAIIPAIMIWQLQMPMKRKLVLTAMLGCGIFAFACAIVKIYYLQDDGNSPDLTWNSLYLYVWHTNEVNVVIVAGCLPTLRPLWLILFRRPGYEEFLHRSTKHTIQEETRVTVQLSSRTTTRSDLGKSHTDRDSSPAGLVNKSHQAYNQHGYGHQAWAGSRKSDDV